MKLKKHLPMLYKFILSYIIILLIPIIVISAVGYKKYINILKNEILTNNLNTLNKTKNIIDMQIIQLEKICRQISLDHQLRPFSFYNDPYKALDIPRKLKHYTVTNPFLDDLVLYYKNDNYLYSSSSSYNIDLFINKLYVHKNLNQKNFYNIINRIHKPVIKTYQMSIKQTQPKEYKTFYYPLSTNGIEYYGTLMFIVQNDKFKKLLSNSSNSNSDNTLVFNDKLELISNIKDVNYLHALEFTKLLNTEQSQFTKSVTLNNTNYLVSFVKSEQTNWRYITLTPIKSVMSKVKSVQLSYLYSLFVIMTLGSIIIYFFIHMNYNPIAKLKQYCYKIINHNEKLYTQNGNEFDSVIKTLDYLSEQNIVLHDKIKANYLATKQYLLLKLLKGNFNSLDDFNNTGKDLNINFTYTNYLVCIFYYKQNLKTSNISRLNLINALENNINNNYQSYAIEPIEHSKIILIMACKKEFINNIFNEINNLHQLLIDKFNITTTLGIGTLYNEIYNIPKSYLEASAALDYRFVKGYNSIINFNEFSSKEIVLTKYPNSLISKLRIAITESKIDKIIASINEIVDYFNDNNLPIFIAKGICFDTLNTVIQTMEELKYSAFSLIKDNYPDIFSFTQFETIDELIIPLKQICIDICSQIERNKETDSKTLTNNMVKFIESNCYNSSFSIKSMAYHFNMPSSTLSQYFKKHTGTTINDYVTYIKINYAKKLLLTTSLNTTEIALKIGYNNVTSFNRRFKQKEGMTPKEFRDSNLNLL